MKTPSKLNFSDMLFLQSDPGLVLDWSWTGPGLLQPCCRFPFHSLLWRRYLKFEMCILSSRLLRLKRQQAAAVHGY